MNTCKDCGARMRHLGSGNLMCEALYDLMIARYFRGDKRPVTHADLQLEQTSQ